MLTSLIRKAYSVASGQLRTSCGGWFGLSWFVSWTESYCSLQFPWRLKSLKERPPLVNLIIPWMQPLLKLDCLPINQDTLTGHNWKWLSPVREAHDPLMGISGVKPWPGLTVNQRYPLLSPPYNLTDHIPQIAGSACGPGVVFMVNGRSTFSFLSTLSHAPHWIWEREKCATKRGEMGQI